MLNGDKQFVKKGESMSELKTECASVQRKIQLFIIRENYRR